MPFSNIDHLKNDFPSTRHSILSEKTDGIFQLFVDLFYSQKYKQFYTTGGMPIKNVSMDSVPTVPNVFTIGLRFDYNDTNQNFYQYWNITDIKTVLKQYFNILKRYLCSFWLYKDCDQWNTFPMTAFAPIISKCLKKNADNENATVIHIDRKMLSCDNKKSAVQMVHAFNKLLQHSSSEQCGKCDQKSKNVKKISLACNNCISFRYTSQFANDSKRCNLRKDAYNTTLKTSKSQKKRSKKNIENSGSKVDSSVTNIKTIFLRNSTNSDNCKNEIPKLRKREGLKSKKMVDHATRSPKRILRLQSKASESVNTSVSVKEHIYHSASTSDVERKRIVDHEGTDTLKKKNLTTIYRNSEKKFKKKSPIVVGSDSKNRKSEASLNVRRPYDDAPNMATCSSKQFTHEGECFSVNKEIPFTNCTLPSSDPLISSDSLNSSTEFQNYAVTDTISEIMILGTVKKRLEIEYDEYLMGKSTNEENDCSFGLQDSRCALEASNSSSDTKINSQNNQLSVDLNETRSTLAKSRVKKKRGVLKNHPSDLLLKSVHIKDLRGQVVRNNLTSSSCSMHYSYTNFNDSQGSRRSLLERECRPISPIKYCISSKKSPVKLESRQSENYDARFENNAANTPDYTFDALSLAYEGLSSDNSLKDNELLLEGTEVFDKTFLSSYAMCCGQRNSTPTISKSCNCAMGPSDSGILTDYSSGYIRTSKDNLRKERKVEFDKDQKHCRQKLNLPAYDFNTDSSYSDESLYRRVDEAVKIFTENLILAERKAKIRLQELKNITRRKRRRKKQRSEQQDGEERFISTVTYCDCLTDDSNILSSSASPILSFSDSEVDQM